MSNRPQHTPLHWLVLLLVGSSIAFSTLHSHHEVEWNHSTQHTDSEHCLTENTNVCPISGYLFNANVVDGPPRFELEKLSVTIVFLSASQQLDPFFGAPAGRSPPVIV